MTDINSRFGQLVLAHRKRQGLTQAKLGLAAGLSATMIVRIEKGKSGASFPKVEALARALGVDVSDLFRVDRKGIKETHPIRADILAMLAGLQDADLAWVRELLEVALRRH